jgi:NADP-dependent 3-hydroxy acid dehydrogenase YdfG
MSMEAGRRLEDRVALVTGASSGLGRATALALAKAGASIALLARSRDELEAAADELGRDGRRAIAVPVDLADASAVEEAVLAALGHFGRIDVLVHAAGTDVPGAVTDLEPAEWDRVQAVNLRAAFLLAKFVWPSMRRGGGGTIVLVSSVAGRRGWARAGAYCASKFALTGLGQALNEEGREDGIRTCVLYPGAMATSWGVWSAAERQGQVEARPAAEALAPEHVADLVVWLATAPPELTLNEATLTPLHERGWP